MKRNKHYSVQQRSKEEIQQKNFDKEATVLAALLYCNTENTKYME